jgi:hypothetical protein
MFVTQPLNELAKLALIASDASYFTSANTVSRGGALAPFRDTAKKRCQEQFSNCLRRMA